MNRNEISKVENLNSSVSTTTDTACNITAITSSTLTNNNKYKTIKNEINNSSITTIKNPFQVILPFPPLINASEIIHGRKPSQMVAKSPNAFFIYRKVFLDQLTLLENNANFKMTDVSKLVSFYWKNELESVKDAYREIAQEVEIKLKEIRKKEVNSRVVWKKCKLGINKRKDSTTTINSKTKSNVSTRKPNKRSGIKMELKNFNGKVNDDDKIINRVNKANNNETVVKANDSELIIKAEKDDDGKILHVNHDKINNDEKIDKVIIDAIQLQRISLRNDRLKRDKIKRYKESIQPNEILKLEESNKNKTKSSRQNFLEALKSKEKREHQTGFEIPDLLDPKNVKILREWDGDPNSLSRIKLIHIQQDPNNHSKEKS
ncbi:14621_t:CDS:2 [Entrophospora sp. SA101]|nr:14621_t:CDS:2 [Entrophospora sp. SA101]